MKRSKRFKKKLALALWVLFFVPFWGSKAAHANDRSTIPGVGTCITSDPGEPPNLPDIFCVLVRVINALLAIVAGVAMIFLILGGIRYATAGGDEKALEQAQKAITYAILGLVISLGAVLIVNLIGTLLGISEPLTKIILP